MVEPLALPPSWIFAREMQSRFVTSHTFGLAHTICCDDTPLAMFLSSPEKFKVLGIKFAAQRARIWVVREDFVAGDSLLPLLEKRVELLLLFRIQVLDLPLAEGVRQF